MYAAATVTHELSTVKPFILQAETQTQSFDNALFDRFIDYVDVKKSTVKGYLNALKQFAKWIEENDIRQPVRNDIKAYKQYLENAGYSAGTQAQYLQAVKQFFKWTLSEGYYPNIADNIKGAKVRKDIHQRDEIDINAAFTDIMQSVDRTTDAGKRAFALYCLTLDCGLRTVEVYRANVGDIKTIKGKSYLYVQGKGKDAKDAPIYLPTQTKQAIDEYLATRTDNYTKASPLFIGNSNRCNGCRLAKETISRTIKSVLVNAGYDSDRLTAHSLRHSQATAEIELGFSMREVQKLCRHQSPATTEIYVHEKHGLELEEKRQFVADYYRNGAQEQDELEKAHKMLDALGAVKLQAVIEFMKAMQ